MPTLTDLDTPPLPAMQVSRRAVPTGVWGPLAAAAVGGVLNAFAFPSAGWWPLIFLGTPLLLASLTARRTWVAVGAGALGGAAFLGTHIFWLTVYLGPAPWAALTGLETVLLTAGAVVIALAWRATDAVFVRPWLRSGVTPVVIAGLWTAREYVTSNWPYGGFSWGRLAFSQSESPYGDLAAWVGIAGLSFLIAWVSALVVQTARTARAGRPRAVFAVAAVALVGLAAVPPFPVQETGKLRVAAIQGNSDAGLLAANQPGRILNDHVAATIPVLDEPVDLVVWPENASDLNPLEYPAAADALDLVSARMDAPVVVGTVTQTDAEMFNSLLLWEAGKGTKAQYDKKHPVPFAEYLPDRDFWYPLAPELFSLVPRDISIGERPNVFGIDGVQAGLAICFDIVDDTLIREMVGRGAEVILAPTNNADFGRTDQSAQQLAIARLRAIETGRSVVNISTVGTSAMVGPDGSTIDRLPTFTPGAMVQSVPLSTTITPAMATGQVTELGIILAGLSGFATAGFLAMRVKNRLRG
ncbi:apolipoprotein N-acyltransferase [Mycetocola zhadangensis]|uniref:apolipoprotein N-acyltransferase n=1 Tax=Mycetocola zhadangensis TaxID=1164595 RepID=UPI003A4DEF78